MLNNSGTGTQENFAVTSDASAHTVIAGSSAAYHLTLVGSNGYKGTVTFTCSGLPAKTTCSFNPASVVAKGNVLLSTTMTINTTAATASLVAPIRPNSKPGAPIYLASLGGLGIFGLVLAGGGMKRNRRRMGVVLGLMLLAITFSAVGCSDGDSASKTKSAGTPAGSYNVVVTSTGTGSTTPTHTMDVSLLVQ